MLFDIGIIGAGAVGSLVARELARYGIRCNTIAPGVILTPMTGVLSEKTLEGLKKSAVFPKRLGKPEEFASVACEILRNLYINGTTIYLDGAMRM